MSFSLPTFGVSDDLLFRLTQGRSGANRQVVFMLGSALTAPLAPGEAGVPRVAGMVELIRDELASSPEALKQLDERLAANPSDSYQTAFSFLQNRFGQDRANRVVRKAVLRARVAGDTNQAVLEGESKACQALEKDLQGWALNPALDALGQILARLPDTFGQMVLTSNFDPLIGISIRSAGGPAYRTVLHGDGSLGQTVADGCQVVHFHGYWHGSDTLHTAAQLGHARPRLEASLAELLRHQAMLVAVGYGGWDDVLTSTLMRVVLEAHAYPEVLWAFYEKQQTRIEQRYARLLEGLRPGLGRGRVTLYHGIDAHDFFPRLAAALGVAPAVDEGAPERDSARLVPPRVALNPYTPASCRLFYGREDVMRQLLSDEQRGQSNILLGGRRCGKTRLLERLAELLRVAATRAETMKEIWLRTVPDGDPEADAPLLSKPHWPVLVSVQGYGFNSAEEFLAHLGAIVVESNPPISGSLPPPPGKDLTTRAFEKWLCEVDEALDKAGLGGLALLVDEIEELFRYSWCHDLMLFFRLLDDHTLKARVWIVLSGSDSLDRYAHPGDGSPPLNTTRRVLLPGLDDRARRRMMVEPFANAGRPTPPETAQRLIDHVAAGNVWILTLLLERLFDHPEWGAPSIEDLSEELLEELSEVFQRWCRALDSVGWEIYRIVAAHGSVADKQFRGTKKVRARNVLEYHGLVHRQRGTVELGPELFRRWAAYEEHLAEPFVDRSELIEQEDEDLDQAAGARARIGGNR